MEKSLIEKEIKQEDKPEIKGKITEKAKKAIIWFIIINLILTGTIYLLYKNPYMLRLYLLSYIYLAYIEEVE
jgi:hypothetical protein